MRSAKNIRMALAVMFTFVVLSGFYLWIRNFVIPSNLEVVTQAIRTIEAEYQATGQFQNAVASAKRTNCWGQPIRVFVVRLGSPIDAIDVTVTSPGPFGFLGVAKVIKIIKLSAPAMSTETPAHPFVQIQASFDNAISR